MPARPCLGCQRLIRSGSRCRRCARSRFNKAKRGNGWQATKFRTRVLAEHGDRCLICGASDPGSTGR